MTTLFGVASQPVAPSQPDTTPEAVYKRPGSAFVLSLLFPGLGHAYCRKYQTALVTAGFFTVGICVLVFSNTTESWFWAYCLRGAVVLYMFGFLDAYYTAREINCGISQYIVGNNPRVAATLNLLTSGFGYFYLGERTKGLVCVIVLRVVGGTGLGQGSKLLSVIVEVVAIGMTADAYRIARRQLQEAFPEQSVSPFTLQSGLSPWVPAILGIFFVFNYVVLVVVGISMPSYAHLEQSVSFIDNDSVPRTYRNATYGVEVRAPEGWEFEKGKPPSMLEIKTLNGACNVYLVPTANLPWRGLVGDSHLLAEELTKDNKEFRMLSERPAELNGVRAHQMVFTAKYDDIEVIQRYIVAQKRLSAYVLIETFATTFSDRCSPAFEQIETGLKLPN